MANQPTDVGRTSGGGSLGHKQPGDVARETPIRNEPDEQPPRNRETIDRGRDEERRENPDPVMPSDESTLRTKI